MSNFHGNRGQHWEMLPYSETVKARQRGSGNVLKVAGIVLAAVAVVLIGLILMGR